MNGKKKKQYAHEKHPKRMKEEQVEERGMEIGQEKVNI